MKWYFAIDEVGTCTKVGWHARLALASALSVGGLEPVLLYAGQPNGFTQWAASLGVRILPIEGRLAPAVRALDVRAPGYISYLGHWLRSNICLLEQHDEYVLYTDCDVVFLHQPVLDQMRPRFIACAPEFRQDDWSYFNSGVMVMNVPALREDYPAFERFVLGRMATAKGTEFLDQEAYNDFYGTRWDRLEPRLNWKPYWGFDPAAADRQILHCHGPKLPEVLQIMAGHWPLDSDFERGIAGMFLPVAAHYVAYARWIAERGWSLPDDTRALLDAIVEAAEDFDRGRLAVALEG